MKNAPEYATKPHNALSIMHSRTTSTRALFPRPGARLPQGNAVEAWRLASEQGGDLFSPFHNSGTPVPPDTIARCVANPAHRPPVKECSCGIHALRTPSHLTGAVWGDLAAAEFRDRPLVLIPVILFHPLPDRDFIGIPGGDQSIRGRNYTIRGPIITAHTETATRLRSNGHRATRVPSLSSAATQIAAGNRLAPHGPIGRTVTS